MKKLVCVLAVFYGYEVIWGGNLISGFFHKRIFNDVLHCAIFAGSGTPEIRP